MYTFSDRYSRLSSRGLATEFYLRGHSQIIAVLFRRYQEAVFRLCLSYLKYTAEAEDATMEIFEHLPRHLRRYQIRHFNSWLMRYTRNHCLQRIAERQRRRHDRAQSAPIFHPPWEDRCLESKTRWEQTIERLHRAMDQLKHHQRECLFGFYYEQLSYKEIAKQLSLSPKAVKSHIQNGKRNLRKFLTLETGQQDNYYV